MALKKNSPFKIKKIVSDATVSIIPLPNDPQSLESRKKARQYVDLNDVSLEMRFETNSKKKPLFKRDFGNYVERFPHHHELIKQLIVGIAHSDIGRRHAAFQSYQTAALAIENFIEFLNSDEPLSSNVFCLADIAFVHAKMYHSWLLRTAPGRSSNRKLYAAIRSAVVALQKNYAQEIRIGKGFSWPSGPRQNEAVSESYSMANFNQLVDCCLTDINEIVSRMSRFPDWVKSTPVFVDHDGVQPYLRFNKNTNADLTLTESNLAAFATAHRLAPNWPLGMNIEEATKMFSYEEASANWDLALAEQRAYKVIQSSRFGPEGAPLAVGQLAYFSHFVFSTNTIYPFYLFVQLNTGWNEESILALTDCVDDHIENDLVDEHYCIIYSSKQRNQQAVSHRSNKKSPLSVYRVLKFIEGHVTKHKESSHYLPGSLWQFVLAKNLWTRYQRLLSIFSSHNLNPSSQNFLKRHNLDIGKKTKKPAIESRRIRTTYQTRRREQGLSTEEMVDLMGHKDIDTTAQNYDSDSGSVELKNRKIRHLQKEHLTDIQNYNVRLIQSTTLQNLREAISNSLSKNILNKVAKELNNVTEAEIVHLLSPEGATYIAACTNAREPTWEDAEKFVSPGDRCRFFNRCCMCDKAIIFKEALPWVIRRIVDLDELRLKISAPEWASNYGDESHAWKWIISNWNNTEDIDEARSQAASGQFNLPLTMIGS